MKKQNDKPLTEAVFVSTIKELRETFATKVELKAVKEDLQIEIVLAKEEMNKKFEESDEKNRGYRDEILTRIDSFAKRIVNLEEEGEVGTYQAEKLRKKVDGHETRLKSLETAKN